MIKNSKLTIRISEEDKKRFAELAEERNTTITRLIMKWLNTRAE